MCLSLRKLMLCNARLIHSHDVVVEQVSHRANLASASQHVKWYPAGREQVRVDGEKFTVIIGNYFRISTRLSIFAESRKIHECWVCRHFCDSCEIFVFVRSTGQDMLPIIVNYKGFKDK